MKKLLLMLMLCLAVTAAQAIVVENFSFEQPGTEKIKGWNGEGIGGTPAVDIPGWASDTAVADSGVESDWPGSTEGSWAGYLMVGDPSAFNLTGHSIAAGEIFQLQVDARDNWSAASADLMLSLYYDVDGVRTMVASTIVTGMPTEWATYSLSFSADDVPGAIGKLIGIELQNVSSSDSWEGIDNVRLDLVPEPASLALLGFGALAALRRRK